MFIEDYGFIILYNDQQLLTLEHGIPIPEFGKRVTIKYNGIVFASYTENNASISCDVFFYTQNIAPHSIFNRAFNKRTISIEKNKLYDKYGREATFLSKIFYTLQSINKQSLLEENYGHIMKSLQDILEEKYTNIYAQEREEREVC